MTELTIHGSAVLIGAKAALIRGPSGAGKSRLAWALVEAARTGTLPFARLVADDRTFLEARAGRLLVQPAETLAGLLEVRGLGIRRLPHEPVAAVGLVVDLTASDATRYPAAGTDRTVVEGIELPRLAVAAGMQPLPLVLAYMHTQIGAD